MDAVQNTLKTVYSFIRSHLSAEILIYICIAILVLILIWIIMRAIRRRKAEKRIAELEIEVNEIRNNSLPYKFNKASAFAKSNPDIMDKVRNIMPKYESSTVSVNQCEELFSEADEYLNSHRLKKAMRNMDELENMLDDTKEKVRIVTQFLDHILERETEVREAANALKERFRGVKTIYQENRSTYYTSSQYFDTEFAKLEDAFTNFEEWMYASEFNKAKEEIGKMAIQVDALSGKIAQAPSLYEKAKHLIPQAMEEVRSHLMEMQEQKIDLSYLTPEKKLEKVEKALMHAVNCMDNGGFDEADEVLADSAEYVLTLQDDIETEKQAFIEIHSGLNKLGLLDEIEDDLREIKSLYANIKDRFGLEDWSHRFALADEQLLQLKNRRMAIEKNLKEDESPSVELVHNYRDFIQEITDFEAQIKDMKQMLVGASSDESRAKKQLIKLQLILNEVRLNASTHQLPNISSQFDEDIQEGERLIQRVRMVLNHSPLDVQTLNADLQDAIDFVYKLYNNANNLIGIAIMVENAIVFGNRFRSTYPSMDSELTRAEFCFQNGEYTRALKIAIQAIENLHPGIYEKLVARKDPAVMNQA